MIKIDSKAFEEMVQFSREAMTTKSYYAYGGRTTKEMSMASWFVSRFRIMERRYEKFRDYAFHRISSEDINYYRFSFSDVETSSDELILKYARAKKTCLSALIEINKEFKEKTGHFGFPFIKDEEELMEVAERLFIELVS